MIYKKICNGALFVTSIFVFVTWSWIDISNLGYFDNKIITTIIEMVLKFISAFGFFSIIVSITAYILVKIPLLKKIIFGSSYFEGRWVGYYVAPSDNAHVIFYHIIEQNIDYTNISTWSYNVSDMSFRGLWDTTSEVSINIKKSEMSYLYEFDGINPSKHTHGMFTGKYFKEGIFKIPCRMTGHGYNSESHTKFLTETRKISHSTIMNNNDKSRFLQEAHDFYNNEVLKHEQNNVS